MVIAIITTLLSLSQLTAGQFFSTLDPFGGIPFQRRSSPVRSAWDASHPIEFFRRPLGFEGLMDPVRGGNRAINYRRDNFFDFLPQHPLFRRQNKRGTLLLDHDHDRVLLPPSPQQRMNAKKDHKTIPPVTNSGLHPSFDQMPKDKGEQGGVNKVRESPPFLQENLPEIQTKPKEKIKSGENNESGGSLEHTTKIKEQLRKEKQEFYRKQKKQDEANTNSKAKEKQNVLNEQSVRMNMQKELDDLIKFVDITQRSDEEISNEGEALLLGEDIIELV